MKQEDVQTATSIAEEITEAVKTGMELPSETFYREGYVDGLKDGESDAEILYQAGLAEGRVRALRETKEDLENITVDLEKLNDDYNVVWEDLGTLREASDKSRNKHLAIGFGVGVTTGATIGLLAFLRERKVKNHIISLIEDMAVTFEKEAEASHPDDLEHMCVHIANLMLNRPVRSFRNPLGISKKDSDYVITLLMSIVHGAEQIVLKNADIEVANPEDIKANVKTTPVE